MLYSYIYYPHTHTQKEDTHKHALTFYYVCRCAALGFYDFMLATFLCPTHSLKLCEGGYMDYVKV